MPVCASHRPLAGVLELDLLRLARGRRAGRLAPAPCLNAGLFIGTEHIVVGAQRLPLPAPCIEIEDAARFGGKLRIARKDPEAVPPRLQRVPVQEAPDRTATDRADGRVWRHQRHEVGQTPPTERLGAVSRQFTGDRFDRRLGQRGKKRVGVPFGADPVSEGRPRLPAPSVCATCGPNWDVGRGVGRQRRSPPRAPRAVTAPASPAGPRDAPAWGDGPPLPGSPQSRARARDGKQGRAWASFSSHSQSLSLPPDLLRIYETDH